jgi:hypothetical protein
MVIDYAAQGTALLALLGPAVIAGLTVGAAVLAARIGWKFFKSFAK